MKNKKNSTITLPKAALKYISTYPNDNKILCEIDIKEIEEHDHGKTLDEIINNAQIPYIIGDFKSTSDPQKLLTDLKS